LASKVRSDYITIDFESDTDVSLVGTTPAVLGYGTLAAVVLGAFDFTGGTLKGFKKDPELDEFERKQALRANRRRPIEETLSELGEGRGMPSEDFHEFKLTNF
jgi:hypothetical protein